MSDLWITYYRSNGWPEHTTITVRATDGRDGEPYTGKVGLAMRKGDDVRSDVPIRMGQDSTGNDIHLEADFQNGKWEIGDLNLKAFADLGFDTLVLDAQGRKIPRTFRARPAESDSSTGKTFIDFTGYDLTKKDEGRKYDVIFRGIINRGGRPLKNTQLDFFWEGKIDPKSQLTPGEKTDDNGRFSFTFEDHPAVGRRVKLEVQIRGGLRSRPFEVDIPAAPREKETPKPTKLEPKLVRTTFAADSSKATHRLLVLALDQFGVPINGGKLTWTLGEGKAGGEVDLTSGSASFDVEITEVEAKLPFDATAVFTNGMLSLKESLILIGPPRKKEDETPKPTKLSEPLVTGALDPADPETMVYTVCFSVLNDQGKGVPRAKVGRMFTDGGKEIKANNSGFCKERNVRVKGYDSKPIYQIYLPGTDERKDVELPGPKKKEPETPKVYSIEANLELPHPVGGKFLIAGTIKIDGKPGNALCSISSSPDDTVVTGRLGKVEPGDTANTYKLTPGNGNFKLAVQIPGDSNTLMITAPDGTFCDVRMVKPKRSTT